MMIPLLLVVLLLKAARLAFGDSTNAPIRIGASEAAQHYDQLLTVTGKVAQVSLRPTIVFINLDQPFPKSPMAAIIHSKDTNQFGNLSLLKGSSVEITGRVVKYHDHPEIVLTNRSQLLIVTNLTSSLPGSSAPSKGTNDLTHGVM